MASIRRRDPVLEPFEIKGVRLKNRILSTAHAPSYVEDGKPQERYRLYHEEKAKGGLAMSMFGGSTTTATDSPSAFGQINAATDAVIPCFRELAAVVQRHDCRIMCQITHMGRRTCDDVADWMPTIAPSPVRERQHRSFPKAMEDHDFARVLRAYAGGARRCQEGGLDGCEVIAWGHLVDQFLSPAVNRRTDRYGGSLENRCRFALEVFEAIRNAVGADFVVGIRLTGDEHVRHGRDPEECVAIAQILGASGLVDFFNVVGGSLGSDAGVAYTIPSMGNAYGKFLDLAGSIRRATGLPVFQAARIPDLSTARWALEQGFVDMVGMTRAHMADPHIVAKLTRGEEHRIRPCVGMGYCIDRIYQGKDALCIHNAATGREATMPHLVRHSGGPARKVVVIGGGPAGMEAARVARLRGHDVVLLEATDRLGGQVNLAFRAPGREELNPSTEAALRRLARQVKGHEQDTISISAFAAGTPEDPSTARRLSLGRALAARAVLIDDGIASNRIYPRALGAAPDSAAEPDRVDVIVNAAPNAPAAAPSSSQSQ